jgi:hypothetical protein
VGLKEDAGLGLLGCKVTFALLYFLSMPSV